MAKKNKDEAPAESTASATETPTEGTPVTEENQEGASTALVPAADAEIAPVDAAPEPTEAARNKALAARLPARYREDVLFMQRPTPTMFMDLIEKLPDDMQTKMMDLIRKTRPKKQGAHSAREGFSPTQVRVNQGTGNDPSRPQKHPPGNFYTVDSRDLGDVVEIAILGFFEGRTMWPPRDQGGDAASKGPICFSLDRMTGSKYGDCQACPNASRKYTEGGCGRELTIWFVDRELTAIYEYKFTKSAISSGDALKRILDKADNVWDRWFILKNDERAEGDRRWYVTKATPFTDPKNPGASNTDRQAHPLFEALSKLLDADVYFPNLADCYDRSRGSTDTGGAVAAGVDEAKLLSSGSAGETDYSDNAEL